MRTDGLVPRLGGNGDPCLFAGRDLVPPSKASHHPHHDTCSTLLTGDGIGEGQKWSSFRSPLFLSSGA